MTSGTWDIAPPPGSEDRRRPLMTGVRRERPVPASRTSWVSRVSDPVKVDFTQAEARAHHGGGHYLDFDPRLEVEELCRPLAGEVAALLSGGVRLADRRVFGEGRDGLVVEPLRDVEAIARSVRDLRRALVEALATKAPQSLVPAGARDRLAALVSDPGYELVPVVVEADLVSGAWVDRLVEFVAPVADDVAATVAAQPAGRVSALDQAISDALSTMSGDGGLSQRVAMLSGRMRELNTRRSKLLEGREFAAYQAAQREQQRSGDALRRLGLS